MKLDLTKTELKEFEMLNAIISMKSQQERLLSLAAELQFQSASYEDHMGSLRRFEKSVDTSWIEKDEEPSEFYLTEKEIKFKDGKII